MGWEYRIFFQPKPDSPSVLHGIGSLQGTTDRTDVYWVHSEDYGIKERSAREFMQPYASSDFDGLLELKVRMQIDERGYEKWEKHKLPGGIDGIEQALQRRNTTLLDPVQRLALRKIRTTAVVDSNVDMEETHLTLPQLGKDSPAFAWKTVSVEGKRNSCDSVRGEVLERCQEQAVEGTLVVCGYPEFVRSLSQRMLPAAEAPIPHKERRPKPRSPMVTHGFSLVVCQHPTEPKYLAVKESRNRGWWLPSGHVDEGETFAETAIKETIEEAGVEVVLTGILAIEHSRQGPTEARMRVIYLATPKHTTREGLTPKQVADEDSECADWLTTSQLRKLSNSRPPSGLRGSELLNWAEYLELGGSAFPLAMMQEEQDGPCPELMETTKGNSGSCLPR